MLFAYSHSYCEVHAHLYTCIYFLSLYLWSDLLLALSCYWLYLALLHKTFREIKEYFPAILMQMSTRKNFQKTINPGNSSLRLGVGICQLVGGAMGILPATT